MGTTQITEFTPPNHGDKPYDIVIIAGKIVNSHFEGAGFRDLYKQLDEAKKAGLSYCVVGNGRSDVNRYEMLTQLDGKISPSTSLHLFGHGLAIKGKHNISIYDKSDDKIDSVINLNNSLPFTKKIKNLYVQETSNILGDIEKSANGKPVNCHLWSCFGGAAAKDVGILGDGSILTSHSSDNNPTFGFMAIPGIARTIQEYIKNAQLYKEKPEQAAFDSFAREVINAPETVTLSTSRNGKVISHTSRPPKIALFHDIRRYISEHNLKDFFNFRREKLGENINTQAEIQKARGSYHSENTDLEYKKQDFIVSAYNQIGKLKKYIAAINKGNVPGIDVNSAESIFGATPLLIAACSSSKALNKLLATAGISVDQTTIDGVTALHTACSQGNKAALKRLIKAGADLNKADKFGGTPLYFACLFDKTEHVGVVEELLKTSGIDVNKADINGATPLQIACENSHHQIVGKLVKAKGVDINKADDNGINPLMAAIMSSPPEKYGEAVEILAANGAKIPDEIAGKPLKEWLKEKIAQNPEKAEAFSNINAYKISNGKLTTLQFERAIKAKEKGLAVNQKLDRSSSAVKSVTSYVGERNSKLQAAFIKPNVNKEIWQRS